jgi:hypothetical protein
MIIVLLIDDNKEDSQTLIEVAKRHEIQLLHYQNYEAGFVEIRKNPNIQGLIFDAKCWKTQKEQEDEVEPSEDALAEGLKLLADYEKNTERYLPLVVNTGYTFPLQFFKPLLAPFKAQIFEKAKTNPEDIFGHLKKLIQNAENYQIERKYADVFDIFEKRPIYNTLKINLLNILKSVENKKLNKETLVEARKIFETLRSDFPSSQPDSIHPLTNVLWKLTSFYLHKNSPEPSIYAIQSAIFALLEILLWFKSEKEK